MNAKAKKTEKNKQEIFIEQFDSEAQDNFKKQLRMIVGSLTGIKGPLYFDIEINQDSRYNYPKFNIDIENTENLARHMFPRMFEELKIGNFGGGFNDKEDRYCLRVHYFYKHFSQGRNGSAIATVRFNSAGDIIEFDNELQAQ